MEREMQRKGRVLIRALRHDPVILGITLDSRGWANVREVLSSLSINKNDLDIIVSTNDKKRFEYNDNQTKIRASQGHSISGIEVYKDWSSHIPEGPLYHGTADFAVDLIMKSSLVSQSRTHVHLSKDVATAMRVGARHGRPVILEIDAIGMYQDGFNFYESSNGVILIDKIPSQYLTVLDKGLLLSRGLI